MSTTIKRLKYKYISYDMYMYIHLLVDALGINRLYFSSFFMIENLCVLHVDLQYIS